MTYSISVPSHIANRMVTMTLAFETSVTVSDRSMMRSRYTSDDTDQCLFDLDLVQSTAALMADTQGAELLALNGRDGRRILIDLF